MRDPAGSRRRLAAALAGLWLGLACPFAVAADALQPAAVSDAGPSAVAPSAAPGAGASGRRCFSAAQTRTRISEERLVDPFALIRGERGHLRADAIGARLCRSAGKLVYEIDFLGRDGRMQRVYFDAATGRRTEVAGPAPTLQ